MKNANPNNIALSILSIATFSLGLQSQTHAANGSFGGGDGQSVSTAWLVEDCIDLQAIGSGDVSQVANDIEDHYKLANDIDCAQTANGDQGGGDIWTNTLGFEPIGIETAGFSGSIYGNNKTISNLYINRPLESDVGFIGYGIQDGAIYNLEISNADIAGDNDVGIMAGESALIISDSKTSGSVIGNTWVGGLVGYNWYLVNRSSSSAYVRGNDAVGGLVGTNEQSIIDSYARADVEGLVDNIGGLVGHNTWEITDSYSASTVSGAVAVTDIGGLVGLSGAVATVETSFYDNEITDCNKGGNCNDFLVEGATTTFLQNEPNLAGDWDFTHKTGSWLFAPGINNGYAINGSEYSTTELAQAHAGVSTLSAEKQARIQEILSYIQGLKGADYNEALPGADLTSNKVMNGLREAGKIAHTDQEMLESISYIAEIYANLASLPTTLTSLTSEIRDWRLKEE